MVDTECTTSHRLRSQNLHKQCVLDYVKYLQYITAGAGNDGPLKTQTRLTPGEHNINLNLMSINCASDDLLEVALLSEHCLSNLPTDSRHMASDRFNKQATNDD